MEKQVDELNDTAKQLMADFGFGQYSVPSAEKNPTGQPIGQLEFTVSEGSRSTISGELLLEAGVTPDVVERCTKKSEYTTIGQIKFVPEVK